MVEPSDPGAYAVRYARNGWAVLPTWWVTDEGRCACDDAACPRANWGKHPLQRVVPAGLRDATTNVAVVTLWWGAYPEANVAVVCDRSNLVVIDVDPRNGGDEAWAQVEGSWNVPATVTASTGGGGKHIFLRDDSLRASGRRPVGKITRGIDVKWSGYVLVAPSNHASGGRYSWDDPSVQIADCAPVLDLITNPREQTYQPGQWSEVLDVAKLFEGVEEGGRHQAFVSYAASLRARRVREVEAELLISAAWSQVDEGEHPFPLTEALRILHDTYATRPEGTSDDVQLEGYAAFINSQRGLTGVNGSALGVVESNGNLGNLGNLADFWTARDNERAARFADALLALPEELAPIREAMLKQQLQAEARTLITRVQQLSEFREPNVERLDVLLQSDLVEPAWVVAGLHEHGANSSLTAQFKTGKTTVQLNLIRALADRVPFLDAFEVRELSGNVAFFNYELTRDTFVRWAARIGIAHPERVIVVNLRGVRLELGLERTREWVAAKLREYDVEFWVADPLARAYYGDENSNSELKLWTDAVDEVKYESGCPNFQVTLHTGRAEQIEGEERARGATRIDDWVDARWVLVRSGTDRFLRATGRDVEVEERLLTFDPDTWRLSVNQHMQVTRSVHRDFQAQQRVVEALQRVGAVSISSAVTYTVLRGHITGDGNQKRSWVNQAVTTGLVQSDGTRYWVGEPLQIIDVNSQL